MRASVGSYVSVAAEKFMPCRTSLEIGSDSDDEGDEIDGAGGEGNPPPVTMAGVGPPPAGPECLVQAVLMEVLVILVSSGDKQADRAVVEAVWELLHEFDAMCRLLANVRSPCLPLAKASMQLLTKMHNSKRFSVGPRSILQVRQHWHCHSEPIGWLVRSVAGFSLSFARRVGGLVLACRRVPR